MHWNTKSIFNFNLFQRYIPAYIRKRWKSYQNRKAAEKKKIIHKDEALEHFDEFYGSVFNKKWPSIRLALLSTQKYIAVVNNFSDTERVISSLESLGGINIRKVFEIESQKLNDVQNVKHKDEEKNKLSSKIKNFSQKKKEDEYSTLYPLNKQKSYEEVSDLDKFDSEDRLIDSTLGMSASTLSEFVPATTLAGMENWVSESEYYSRYANNQPDSLKTASQYLIEFPPYLHVYFFEIGNVERFPSPKKGSTNVSDYYLLNGGSLLPVLALNLKPGDDVLDMCAAPGGKSLLCLQTLYPRTVLLNDVSHSRINRTEKVMNEYFYDVEKRKRTGDIILSHVDGRFLNSENGFNKILVDVPCTNDRLSVVEDDNNIFKSSRIKERLKIPELQAELLINALKLVRVGGTVVYSTCSLSPTQNDGVIAYALRMMSQQSNNEYIIIDMKDALQPFNNIVYAFGSDIGLQCGHLVIPYLPLNFGPTYFCKIVRLS